MKSGTTTHPKMEHLARELGVQRYVAVGIMESLWHWAADYFPDGQLVIGRMEVFERAIDLRPGAGERVLEALVSARWIDRGEDGALVLHDWPEHSEDRVHMKLARSLKHFADGSIPRLSRFSHRERERINAHYEVESVRINAHTCAEMRTDPHTPQKRDQNGQIRAHKCAQTPESVRTAKAKAKAFLDLGSAKDQIPERSQGKQEPCQIASILGGFEIDSPDGVLKRVFASASPEPEWRRWWALAIGALADSQHLPEFSDHVRYVEDCANEVTRSRKDLGELKHPDRFLSKKLLAIAREHGVKVPEMPLNRRGVAAND